MKTIKPFDYIVDDPEEYILLFEKFVSNHVEPEIDIENTLFKLFLHFLVDKSNVLWWFEVRRNEKFSKWKYFKKEFTRHSKWNTKK